VLPADHNGLVIGAPKAAPACIQFANLVFLLNRAPVLGRRRAFG